MLLLDKSQAVYLGSERVTQIWTGVRSENLIDPSYEIHNKHIGQYTSFESGGYTIFIPIEIGHTYYYTQYTPDGGNTIIAQLATESKSLIYGTRTAHGTSGVATKTISVKTTTDYPTAKYLAISWYYDDFEWQMVRKDYSDTTYVPFEIKPQKIFDWKPYTELEWIQTNSTTGGWIIDFTPTPKTLMTLNTAQTFAKDIYDNNQNSGKGIIFSAGSNYAGAYYSSMSSYGMYQNWFGYSLGGGGIGNTGYVQYQTGGNRPVMNQGTIVSIQIISKKCQIGSAYGSHTVGSGTVTNQLALGGELNGFNTSSYVFGDQKFQSCIIYDTDGTTELYHLIAVLRKSDQTPCLYDTISGKYYTTTGATPTEYKVKS